MARLPDGLLLLTRENRKELSIELYQTEFVKCKHCKYYEVKDHFGNWNGVPILAAPNCPTCTKWGGQDGCKTDPEGWCFLAELRCENDHN